MDEPTERSEQPVTPADPPLPISMAHGAALFAVRAVVAAIAAVVLRDEAGAADAGLVIAAFVDGALALVLAVGWERAIALALGRAVLVGIVEVAMCVASDLHGLAVMTGASAVSVVIVLAGTPGLARARAGLALGAVSWVALLVAVTTGLGSGSFVRLGPLTELRGAHLPYRLTLPPTGWELRDDAEVALEAPEADAWAVRHDVGANVLVSTRLGADPQTTSVDALERELIDELESFAEVARIDGEEVARGRIVHLVAREAGRGDVDVIAGIFLVPGVAYDVRATIASGQFAAQEAELRAIVRSFDPGP